MTNLWRRIYGVVLRLHPAAFRNQFGREMLLDFEDSLRDRGLAVLLGDAFLSLARQWTVHALPAPEPAQPIPLHPFLAGQYFMVDQGSLTVFDLARATVLAIALFLAIGFAANVPNQRSVANRQTVHAGHDGGTGSTSRHPPPPAATDEERPGAPGSDALLLAPGYGVSRVRPTGRPRRLSVGDGLIQRPGTPGVSVGTLGDVLLQWTLITAVVWVTSFLLRRYSGIWRRVALTALGLLGLAASVVFGSVHTPPIHPQILHATGPLPSFEVATVKPFQRPPAPPPPPPSDGPTPPKPVGPAKIAPGNGGGQTTDRVHTILPAQLLIAFAYNIPFGFERARVLGGPDWAASDQYELQAKIEDSLFAAMQKMTSAQQREQVDLMEQSLLADRFHLKLHFETREMPAFALVIAKGGPKLTPAKDGEPTRISMRGNEMTATATTLDQWIHSPFLNGRTVVDQTGLKGTYDFTLAWTEQSASNPAPESGTEPPSIFTAVQEQLGLKLVPIKAPVEVIVIDHIEKPSAN